MKEIHMYMFFFSSFRSLWNNQQNGETNIIVNVNTLIVQNQLSLPKCFFIIFFHNLSQCLYIYNHGVFYHGFKCFFFIYNFFLCFVLFILAYASVYTLNISNLNCLQVFLSLLTLVERYNLFALYTKHPPNQSAL